MAARAHHPPKTRPLHGFSVDVEDWFHILECDGAPDTAAWARLEDRVAHGTTRLLDVLAEYGHKATFFVLGWVAERHPELLAEIASRGHEIGSHSYCHALVHQQSRDEFSRDLDRSLAAIAKATGQAPKAFRAPGFSIGPAEVWAFDVLASRGIELDASLFLAPRAHGGYPLARRGPFAIELAGGKRLIEVPIVPFTGGQRGLARLTFNKLSLPYSGGGYLRLLPIAVLEALYSHADRAGEPTITYLHPRELDPRQPRLDLPPWRAFKYYVGLHGVMDKLERLFAKYRFGTLSEVAASVELDAPLRLAPTA